MKKPVVIQDEPVHNWFNLTYANYLVLPRSILQSAPVQWQRQFVKLLDQLDEMTDGLPGMPYSYTVHGRDKEGKFYRDFYSQYDRGRRKVELKTVDNSVNNRLKRFFAFLFRKM